MKLYEKKVEFKFLALMVIICLLLSFLIVIVFDIPSSIMNQTSRIIQKEITSQELERVKREGISINELEKILKKYDNKKRK